MKEEEQSAPVETAYGVKRQNTIILWWGAGSLLYSASADISIRRKWNFVKVLLRLLRKDGAAVPVCRDACDKVRQR